MTTRSSLNNPEAETQLTDVRMAARTLGQQIIVLNASSDSEIEVIFATLHQQRIGALVVGADPFFNSRRDQLVALAARHGVPAIYQFRDHTAAGGLMSYGASITATHRQAGIYVGRILRGAKPADLPIMQLTKFEPVINLTTAKAPGLEVPAGLLALAHEVIE